MQQHHTRQQHSTWRFDQDSLRKESCYAKKQISDFDSFTLIAYTSLTEDSFFHCSSSQESPGWLTYLTSLYCVRIRLLEKSTPWIRSILWIEAATIDDPCKFSTQVCLWKFSNYLIVKGADPSHPFNSFPSGNIESLFANRSAVEVARRMKDFHHQFYSSNLMSAGNSLYHSKFPTKKQRSKSSKKQSLVTTCRLMKWSKNIFRFWLVWITKTCPSHSMKKLFDRKIWVCCIKLYPLWKSLIWRFYFNSTTSLTMRTRLCWALTFRVWLVMKVQSLC